MNTQKIFKLISLLIVAAFLVSCVTPATPAAQPTTAAQTTSAPAASTPKLDLQGCKNQNLTDQQVTLRFLRQSYGDAQEAYYKKIYEQWNAAYPNIKIQEETVPFGQLFTKVQTSLASGDPPDIMMGQGDFTRNYVYGKSVLALNDYLTEEYINDYYEPLRDMASVDGKVYLFPYELQTQAIYWNKDFTDKAGLKEPPQSDDSNQTWTLDEWRDEMRKLRKYLDENGQTTVYPLTPSTFGAGGPGSNYWHEGIIIRSYGDPNAPKDSTAYKTWAGISEDGLTASGYVDTPEAIEAMKWYQSLFTENLTPKGAMPNPWPDKIGVYDWGGTQTIRFIPEMNVTFPWGVAPNPKGKVQFTHISGDSPIVSAKTKHPVEATAFLCFLTNDTNRIAWDEVWGPMPARKSVLAKMPKFKEWPYTAFLDEMSKYGAPAPKTAGTLEYETAMNQAIKDIALGADPETRLHEVAKEIDGLLAKYAP